MMKDTRLLIRLKEYVNYASTAESNLAHYITEDPQAVIGKSIHELARLTYTSPPPSSVSAAKWAFRATGSSSRD